MVHVNTPACQTPGAGETTASRPWAGHKRADAKDALLKYARENPAGVRPAVAARAVITPDAIAGDADARLARRLYENNSDLFKIDRRNGNIWAEPRTTAFHLTTNKQDVKHAAGDGAEVDTARRVLAKRSQINQDAQRGTCLQQLAAKRRATDDKYNMFRDRLDAENYLAIPYRTRFNSPSRVAEQRARFGTAWDVAATGEDMDDLRIPADGFDVGQIWTFTTDPSRFDSLLAATESLLRDVNRFKSWVASRFFDETPVNIVVPEFSEGGLPHVHVVLFGVGYLPHAAVSHYWDARRDRGEVVHYDSIRERGGAWVWADGRPGSDLGDERRPAGSCGPHAYLGKTLADTASLAESNADDVQAAASAMRATDVDSPGAPGKDDVSDVLADAERWWKLALYFATDTRFFTCSPSLKPDDDNDGLPHATRWEYVGTARFGDLPGHVQRNATVVRRRGRPPPPLTAGGAEGA